VGGSGGASGSAGGDAEPAVMTGMTAAHNKERASVSPAASPAIPPLVWSSTVAASAQAWAEMCNFKHSGGKYGENIYASAGSKKGPKDVVASWASEDASYDYAQNKCSGTCGHYTQVVWAGSKELGCGYAHCKTNSPFSGFPEWDFWVCNYNPPGNSGGRPYCTDTQTTGCSK
jgi:pathogenesis-related protein 1